MSYEINKVFQIQHTKNDWRSSPWATLLQHAYKEQFTLLNKLQITNGSHILNK
jgi:hypothetical protein